MMELKTTPRDFGIRRTWFEILPPTPSPHWLQLPGKASGCSLQNEGV